MGWESRNSNFYYYRKRWLNGTCVSEYVGQGLLAQAFATLDREEWKKEQIERRLWQQELEDIQSIERQIDELCTQIRKFTRAVLKSTGHHRHKGQWRKKRMEPSKEFYAAFDAANVEKPKSKDVAKFKKMLGDTPEMANMLDVASMIATVTVDKFNATVSTKLLFKKRHTNLMRELGYDEATPLEQLLIWQIGVCWLRQVIIEHYYSAYIDSGITLTKADWWERRLNASQRRFLRACETLTRVRKLASRTPEILQVNIAQQQVNQVNRK